MPSVHRFFDLLEVANVFFYTDETQNLVSRLINSKGLYKEVTNSDIEIVGSTYRLPIFVKIYAAVCRRSHFNQRSRIFWLCTSVLFWPVFFVMSRCIVPAVNGKDFDLVWIGGNNFDRSNVILLWFKYSGKLNKTNVCRSYKESSGKWSLDEFLVLRQKIHFIFPTIDYLQFYQGIYGNEIFNNSVDIKYYDEDLRWSKLKEVLSKSSVSKIPNSVVILTGRLLMKVNTPSDLRYIYTDYVKELLNRNYTVYIHSPRVSEDARAYFKALDGVHLLPSLDLEVSLDGYKTLLMYEYGVLHNPQVSQKLNEFTKINIPNRYFEYSMCDIEALSFDNIELGSFKEFSGALLSI